MSKIPSLAGLVFGGSFPFFDSPVNPPPADHLPRPQYSNRERSELSFLLKTHDILMFEEGLNIFRAAVHSSLVGKFLAENQIRKQTGCSVIAINTQGELNINPDPSIPLSENDEISLIGTADAEKHFFENYCRIEV